MPPALDPTGVNNLGHPSTTPAARPKREGWLERHERYCARAAQGDIDIVFLGDSLTQRWETAPDVWARYFGSRRAVQMGIDNDGTQQLLWRIDHGTLDGVSPRLVVLLIGINNLGNDEATAEAVRDGVAAVIGRIRAKVPAAKILLLGLLPYDRPNAAFAKRIPDTNRLLAALADGVAVHFLDIGHKLLIDGKVHPDHQPDGAHLSPRGYTILADAITPQVVELLGAQPVASIRNGRLLRCVMVPMRDGVRLATTVVLPEGDGPFPVVLVRTAYNRIGSVGMSRDFITRGIATVIQDCRGRYVSEDEFYPFVSEGRDGVDTLAWLKAQPWCNGRIGMFGDSYLAAVQLYLAPGAGPELVALNPRFMAGDLWRNAYYCGGAFSLALTLSWLCFECNERATQASTLGLFDLPKLLREVPLLTLDEKVGLAPVSYYRDYVTHWSRDAFWEDLDVRARAGEFRMPVLLTAGWYDYYPGETLANYRALVDRAPSAAIAAGHRVLIGPWTHGVNITSRLGQLDFGPAALTQNDSTLRWLDTLLHGGSPADVQPAPIRLFVMGANVWRDEHEWPLARTQFTAFHLHSAGSANTAAGDGLLTPAAPGNEPPDRFTYDPDDAVPTLGGNHSIGPYNPGLYELAPPGPYDQAPIERRGDVLCYTTPPLECDLEVTGPVVVHLFASSSASDTDFVARLCDVYPDGRSINITEGVLRARFHERQWDRPRLLEPGRVYEFVIELQPTSNVFKAGHRLRLQVTSSNFPLWSRNHNTGADPAMDTRMQIAQQTVYHDTERRSRLVLPIVPGTRRG